MTDRLERIRAEHMDWNCDARDKEDVAYLLQELDAERRRADRLITGQVIESDCIDSQGVVHPCPWEVSRVAERERDEARAALEGCRSAMIAWAASDGFVLPDEASEAFDAASRLLGLPESVADRDSCMPAEHADDEADVTEAQEWADFDPDC